MEKEAKTNGKKASIVVIVVSIVVIIAVLGFWAILGIQAKQAEKKVTTVISELKDGNIEVLKEYLTSEELTELGLEKDEEQRGDSSNSYRKVFSNLDYKVKKSKANFKNATIDMEITNKNMRQVMNNYFKKSMQLIFQSALSDNDESDEELAKKMNQYLQDELNSDSIEKVTKNITIELSKENGKWIVKTEGKDIVDAILPGFIEVMKNFDDSLFDEESNELFSGEDLNEDNENHLQEQTSNTL